MLPRDRYLIESTTGHSVKTLSNCVNACTVKIIWVTKNVVWFRGVE